MISLAAITVAVTEAPLVLDLMAERPAACESEEDFILYAADCTAIDRFDAMDESLVVRSRTTCLPMGFEAGLRADTDSGQRTQSVSAVDAGRDV